MCAQCDLGGPALRSCATLSGRRLPELVAMTIVDYGHTGGQLAALDEDALRTRSGRCAERRHQRDQCRRYRVLHTWAQTDKRESACLFTDCHITARDPNS